jgi:hypothetical protein
MEDKRTTNQDQRPESISERIDTDTQLIIEAQVEGTMALEDQVVRHYTIRTRYETHTGDAQRKDA